MFYRQSGGILECNIEINDPYGFIYITTNLIDGKRYVGQRKFSNGWQTYLGSGKILQQAIKKYGRKNFKCELIENCETKEDLDNKEMYWIAFYRNKSDCYNITEGGQGRKV